MSGAHELSVERTFAAPRDIVWRAVTEHLTEWWCPRPWRSEIVALDWTSGGRFAITMRGPDGEEHAGDGMLLEVVPGTRFVFTNMLGAGWTPQDAQPVPGAEIEPGRIAHAGHHRDLEDGRQQGGEQSQGRRRRRGRLPAHPGARSIPCNTREELPCPGPCSRSARCSAPRRPPRR